MGYKALLDQKALQAFNMLKDLATDASFDNDIVVGFDFDTGHIQKADSEPKKVKLVVIETKKKDNTITKTVMAKLKDTALLDEYDSLTFESTSWAVGPIIKETGRVLIFEIYREGS